MVIIGMTLPAETNRHLSRHLGSEIVNPVCQVVHSKHVSLMVEMRIPAGRELSCQFGGHNRTRCDQSGAAFCPGSKICNILLSNFTIRS
jgi:hypothetical protein